MIIKIVGGSGGPNLGQRRRSPGTIAEGNHCSGQRSALLRRGHRDQCVDFCRKAIFRARTLDREARDHAALGVSDNINRYSWLGSCD